MKTNNRIVYHSFTGAVCAGAVLLIASSAQAQNLFQVDNGGNIHEFTPGGVQTTFASGLGGEGLAFDGAGNLFVAHPGGNDVIEISPGGTQSIFASGFNVPYGLAFDSAGNLFVADGSANNIILITPGGVRATFASGLVDPAGLAFNSAGDLFEADMHSGNIYEFTPGGVRSTFATGLNTPWGLAFDSMGNLFVADEANGVLGGGGITKITPGGVKSTFASGLSAPNGLAFDNAGNLFVTEGAANDILKFTPGGMQSTFASGLANPIGLAFQSVTLPVPEPSALALLAVGGTALLARRRNRQCLGIVVVGLCVAVTGHALAQTNQNAPVTPWERFKTNQLITSSASDWEPVSPSGTNGSRLPVIQEFPDTTSSEGTSSSTNATALIDFRPESPKPASKTIAPPAGFVSDGTLFGSSHVETTPLVLSNGVVLEIVKTDSIDPDGLNVAYLHRGSNSLDPSWRGFIDHVKIPFELLSKEVQKKYNYDPSAAAAYRKQVAAAYAEYRKKVEEQNEKIAAQAAERRKEELDLEIKIRTLLALEAQAAAQQRQADAQENQSLSQQQINSKLEDLNWQLMRLRQQEQGY